VVADRIISSTDAMLFDVMPQAAAELPGMQALGLKYMAKAPLDIVYPVGLVPFPWVSRPVIRPLGIGDLKVVKQTLQRYVAGEVAHIENVLDKSSNREPRGRMPPPDWPPAGRAPDGPSWRSATPIWRSVSTTSKCCCGSEHARSR
jgi:hypothetical protein